jgi:acetyl-CoA carboxylase biotin carboxyl carrier protein
MSVTKLKERKSTMSSMKIDPEAIRNLAFLLNETGLTEIEIAEGDKRIRVTKFVTVQAFAPAPSVASAPAIPAAPQGGKVVATAPENHPGVVKSPMVGTAYLQQDPASPKFITKGATVKAGDTLLIIEAMKVMNPIKAEKGGTVIEILIEDGQPVEFGQPMVIVE